MENCYTRTVDDVLSMLGHAKQKIEDVNSLTQAFYYPSEAENHINKKTLKLLVLEEDFIKKLENGERFVFKGSEDEKVVLCTENETFEVKEGDISNSLIICPDLLYTSSIQQLDTSERELKEQMTYGIHHNYLELRSTFPKLSKVKHVLSKGEYNGPDKESEESHKGFYFFELLDIIQCSRDELTKHLKEIKAICLEDKWRILSLNYTVEVFSHIITLMEKENWKKIPYLETKKNLNSLIPDFIIDHILMHYASQCVEDPNSYELDEYLLGRCYAEVLLKTAGGKFRFNEFIMAWEKCLNPVVKSDLNNLKGLVLIEKGEGQQKVVYLYSESDLPENVAERFRLLFKRKEKWTLEEITPYIEKLTTKVTNINALLTKYARSSAVKGERIFTARYAK